MPLAEEGHVMQQSLQGTKQKKEASRVTKLATSHQSAHSISEQLEYETNAQEEEEDKEEEEHKFLINIQHASLKKTNFSFIQAAL